MLQYKGFMITDIVVDEMCIRDRGKSVTEAQNMAAMSAKGKVQVQATLVSIKEMAGWTFYGLSLIHI